MSVSTGVRESKGPLPTFKLPHFTDGKAGAGKARKGGVRPSVRFAIREIWALRLRHLCGEDGDNLGKEITEWAPWVAPSVKRPTL